MSSTQLTGYTDIINFIFAGNATITLRSPKTGERFTYRVKKARKLTETAPKLSPLYFIALLSGPDNTSDYQYLGTCRSSDGVSLPKFSVGRKSKISIGAPSARAFDFFMKTLDQVKDDGYTAVEVFHEGRCGRCNRKLTVPESIELGLGPKCATV